MARATDAKLRCAAQHFGMWAVEPLWFNRALAAVRNGTMPMADMDEDGAEQEGLAIEVVDGVAIIPLLGQLLKGRSSFGGTSTLEVRRAIRSAVDDDAIGAILLRVDSPGGTVAGTSELATEVRAAAATKPTWAAIEDLGASAAYWAVAGANRIAANAPAEVGSLGVFAVLEDTSGAYEAAGVKVYVIGTGEYKGAGVDGVEVTEDQLAYFKERVDYAWGFFAKVVRDGRDMSAADLKKVADGRVFGASTAKGLGLIDAVESFDDTLGRLTALVGRRRTARRQGAAARRAVARGLA